MAAFIQFHTQSNQTGQAVPGALLSATSAFGPWQALTNACGDFFTPPPGLAPGQYEVTISCPGYTTRVIPMDLADCGQVLIGLDGQAPPPPGDLPTPPPTRDQVIAVRAGFQGQTAQTQQYGSFPVFGPETTSLNDADLNAYCAQLASNGWTHGEIAISWQYDEPGFLMPVPGADLTENLPELARRIVLMLQHFKVVMLFLAGDGRSNPPNTTGPWQYNDPVGHTYGCEWLMANFPRIAAYLQSGNPYGDLTKYILFSPGYDGVFYGWGNAGEPDLQPQRVIDFGNLFRQCLPQGYLAIEHTPGNIPVGEGGSDWVVGGPMMNYDVVLSEFFFWQPGTPAGDQVWQIVARLNRPYNRPADQPANDDPHPPFYLAYDTPRGPVSYVPFEYATYQWTRGQVSAQTVQQLRDYFYGLGCHNVC